MKLYSVIISIMYFIVIDSSNLFSSDKSQDVLVKEVQEKTNDETYFVKLYKNTSYNNIPIYYLVKDNQTDSHKYIFWMICFSGESGYREMNLDFVYAPTSNKIFIIAAGNPGYSTGFQKFFVFDVSPEKSVADYPLEKIDEIWLKRFKQPAHIAQQTVLLPNKSTMVSNPNNVNEQMSISGNADFVTDIELKIDNGEIFIYCNRLNKNVFTWYLIYNIKENKLSEKAHLTIDDKPHLLDKEIDKITNLQKKYYDKKTAEIKFLEPLLALKPSDDELSKAFNTLDNINGSESAILALVLMGCIAENNTNDYIDFDKFVTRYNLCSKKSLGDRIVLNKKFLSNWEAYDGIKCKIFNLSCTIRMLEPYLLFGIICEIQKQLQKSDKSDPSFKFKSDFIQKESKNLLREIPEPPLKYLLTELAGKELTADQKKYSLLARNIILSSDTDDNGHKSVDHKIEYIEDIPVSLLKFRTTSLDMINKYFIELNSISNQENASGFALVLLSKLNLKEDIPFKTLSEWYNICSSKINKDNPINNKILPYWKDYSKKLKSKIYNADCTDQMLEIFFRTKILVKLSNATKNGDIATDRVDAIGKFIKLEAEKVLSEYPKSPMGMYLEAFSENPNISEMEIITKYADQH